MKISNTMLKKLLFITALCLSIMTCEKKSTAVPNEGFIIRDNVEILKEADRSSAVVGSLDLHDRVEILAELETPHPETSDYMSRRDRWYKIRFNDIEGYIITSCADTQKYAYTVNGNRIIAYPSLANDWPDMRYHNPYWLMIRFPQVYVFINGVKIHIPGFVNHGGFFSKAKMINGNVYMLFGDNSVIINAQGEEIYIVKKDHQRHEQYVLNEKGELDYLGEYAAPGQHREGDFTINKDGTLVAYWGNGGDVIVPETVAGITVRRTMRYENIFDRRNVFSNLRSVRFPSTIRFIYDYHVPAIIIDSNLNIESAYEFAQFYKRNGRKGGTYTYTLNDDARTHSWRYTP
ncbi:MAG: SH3 domain-containing protein [Treponema sp.]|nr:SH3 domain-containing protein [Treponema sp.]